jgi:hypothetical protein
MRRGPRADANDDGGTTEAVERHAGVRFLLVGRSRQRALYPSTDQIFRRRPCTVGFANPSTHLGPRTVATVDVVARPRNIEFRSRSDEAVPDPDLLLATA